MISTIEIVLLVMLTIGLGVAIWWFVVAEQYKSHLRDYSYARGANALNGQTVNLKCDSDKEICVYRATQICTRPDSKNFETTSLEPIASGDEKIDGARAFYGDFNPATTIDLTQKMGHDCNGKEECQYHFEASPGWQAPNGVACNGNTQLIATYSCIPKGTTCQAWSPTKNV